MKTHEAEYRTNIDFVHQNYLESENLSSVDKLLKAAILGYYALAVAKSAAEPQNSNNQTLADSSTPFNRAIFVCSTRTPQENNRLKIELVAFLSMVACSGKGSPFAVFQSSQFLSPLHVTAQTLRSLAVASKNLTLELSAMIYLFKAVSRFDLRKTQKPFTSFPHYTLKVKADSVEQAQARISRLFAVLSVSVVNNSQNPTACDTEQNHSLLSVGGCGYDERTTKTLYAGRKRNSSGIFLPKIHNHGITTPEIHSELAVRATRRNKADFIRTNNADCYKAVVEPLSHPISDKPLSLTKTLYIMKKPTRLNHALTGTRSPIALSSRFEGVAYA